MSITSLRAAVTAAGGTPTQFTHVGLYRELVSALGGTPTKWTIKELLEQAVTAAGGTPTRHSYAHLLRDLITALGGTPVAHDPDALEAELAALTFFHPSSLFGPSDQGFAFDFTDISTLFQTTDTSTPVTTLGQSIGRINDISGKNNHATQGTAANRPTFNGYGAFSTDDRLATGAIDMSATDKFTLIFSVRIIGTGNQGICALGSAGTGRFNALFLAGAAPACRSTVVGSTGTSAMQVAGDTADTANAVYAQLFDIAGATAAAESQIRKNGALPSQTVNSAGPAGAGNWGSAHPVYIGDLSSATTFPLNGRIMRVIGINKLLAGPALTNAEQWCDAPVGVIP